LLGEWGGGGRKVPEGIGSYFSTCITWDPKACVQKLAEMFAEAWQSLQGHTCTGVWGGRSRATEFNLFSVIEKPVKYQMTKSNVRK